MGGYRLKLFQEHTTITYLQYNKMVANRRRECGLLSSRIKQKCWINHEAASGRHSHSWLTDAKRRGTCRPDVEIIFRIN
jgi:hypothetical protein